MRSIIRKVESWAPPAKSLSFDQMFELSDSKEDAMAAAAVFMSKKLGASMILVEGKFGNMARLVSKFRPSVPILSVVESPRIARQLSIHRAVFPTTLSVEDAISAAKKQGLCQSSDEVVKVQVDSAKGVMEMSIIQA